MFVIREVFTVVDLKKMFNKRRCCLCGQTSPQVRLHRFPHDSAKLQNWLNAIGNTYLMTFPESEFAKARICSDHFEDWCYTSTFRLTLIAGAQPCSEYPAVVAVPINSGEHTKSCASVVDSKCLQKENLICENVDLSKSKVNNQGSLLRPEIGKNCR